MSIEYFIIYVFCCVVDEYDSIVLNGPLRKRGKSKKLSDSEVITMEIVGEFLSIDTDKGIWRYFHNHWHNFFPALGSRANFVKQASNLWKVKQLVLQRLINKLGAIDDNIHIVDGLPMPVCQFARAHISVCFKGEAQYGYCATKKQTYYGFHGQIVISYNGIITDFTLVGANVDERDSIWEVTENIHGLLIGDKGYIRPILFEELSQQGIDLQTPLRANMNDPRPKKFVKQLTSSRRLVETVIGQLTERFNIEKVRARDLWHLTNRVTRKLLSHTMAVFLNFSLGRKPLQFDELIKS